MNERKAVATLLQECRRLVDAGQPADAASTLNPAVAAGAMASHRYELLACCAALEAVQGRGFRAYRLAGAAARCRPNPADERTLAVAHWLAGLLLHAGRHLSDDSSSTEWLWGNRMTGPEALAFAGLGAAESEIPANGDKRDQQWTNAV